MKASAATAALATVLFTSGTIPTFVFVLFQMTFAGITVALVLGSVVGKRIGCGHRHPGGHRRSAGGRRE